MSDLNYPLRLPQTDSLPATIAERTRRVYDRLAEVYPVSSLLFHARAHKLALSTSGILDGMTVLEVATGSGEMFRRLVAANQTGATFGLDLSPRMASRTQRRIRREFPAASTLCKAVDVRTMPFRDASFDALVCCYLLELLSVQDIHLTVREFARVVRPSGVLTLILIGQNVPVFNRVYRVCTRVAPAFWGRQVERSIPALVQSAGFTITSDRTVRQTFYPSRILTATRL
ncbi:MAG: methyltransferase domain-containing protein [Bryobacteraceae bacterium]